MVNVGSLASAIAAMAVREKEQRVDFTERFIPGNGDSRIAAEHLVRYFACTELARGKRVLDAASRSGYGTVMLAASAIRATGLDISGDAVRFARQASRAGNVEYVVGSVTDMPFEDNSFDLVVSFETIEHVSHSAQRLLITEIDRVLTANGLLVMSTPDKNLTNQDNPFHRHELGEREFLSLVRSRFRNVDLYFQNVWEYAEILRAGEKVSDAPVRMDAPASKGPYLVAVCAHTADLPRIDALLRCKDCYTAALYEGSMSWRVTRPLRNLKAFVRRRLPKR